MLGDGTFTSRSTPGRVLNLPPVSAIAACGGFGLALAPDHTVWHWGNNKGGQRGDGTFATDPPYGNPTPAPVPGLTDVVAIAHSGGSMLASIFDLPNRLIVWPWCSECHHTTE